ncbi:porin [Buchnera aphidicola]|uniref:porin n=1 Tax=Buchnera aphidicola TaxID=9 RepID=UPI003BEF2235
MLYRYFFKFLILVLFSINTSYSAHILYKNGNKLNIYGNFDSHYSISDFFSPSLSTYKNNIASLGLYAEGRINNQLSSYMNIEYNAYLFFPKNIIDKKNTNALRMGYIGLKHDFWGSIDYGRNYGVMHDAKSLTNRIPYIIKNTIFEYDDYYMMNINNGLLTYRNSNIFGLCKNLNMTLQYQEKNYDRNIEQNNGSGWGASFKYKNKLGFTAVGSFFSSNKNFLRSNKHFLQSNKQLKKMSIKSYGLGLGYNIHNIYLGAFYGLSYHLTPYKNIKNNSSHQYIDSIKNIEMIAEYNFNSKFYPSISYLDSSGDNFNLIDYISGGNAIKLAKQIDISTRYDFNHNISTYVNYKINLLKKNDFIKNNNINTDDIFGAGILYRF